MNYAIETPYFTSFLHTDSLFVESVSAYGNENNGIVERVNGILKTDWLYQLPLLMDIRGETMVQIEHIIDLYSHVRPHWSLQHRTPMAVYPDDPTFTLAAKWHNTQEGDELGLICNSPATDLRFLTYT